MSIIPITPSEPLARVKGGMDGARSEGSVSIVVPTFNRLDYLRPALDSVFAQTWTDWDLIIADDGSDEELRAFFRRLDDQPRVKVLRLPHSGIPAAVRNAGLRQATGVYVAFLDSDDLWAPHKLELQIAAMRARPACQWSYTAFRRVDRDGKVLAEERHRPWHPHEGAIFEQLVTGRASVRTPSVLVARELLFTVGGFDETMRSCEDYDLWMRLALRSPVAIVDEPLVQVRLHDRNHALDWAAAFHGRDRSLVKLHERVDPSLRPLLRRERARNSAGLIAEHVKRRERQPALAALLDGVRHAWRYPEWWKRALRATARLCVPIDPRAFHSMPDVSTRSLSAEEHPGAVGAWIGGVLRRVYALTGRARYDDFRFERVRGMPIVVLPTVANPKVLRTGAFFASQIDARLIGANADVLDMGTGSGICALFAARIARRVVAVDINPAAIRCARVNALLNGLDTRIDAREGDLFAPVAGERFDVVRFNPPFLLGVPRDHRDAAWRSNDIAERFADGLAAHLKPGGVALLMLSTFGPACARVESELHKRGFCLDVVARKRFINETVTLVRVTPVPTRAATDWVGDA